MEYINYYHYDIELKKYFKIYIYMLEKCTRVIEGIIPVPIFFIIQNLEFFILVMSFARSLKVTF